MATAIIIHPSDNVAVALAPISAGTDLAAADVPVVAAEDIPQGHKVALADIAEGQPIVKYGFPIGNAVRDIRKGEHVHTHNLKTGLSEVGAYAYEPAVKPLEPHPAETFSGYLRPDGRAGIRNELWIIPTVGCVNGVAEALARANQHLVGGNIDGLHAFPHPYGCSQMGEDHETTRRLLAALVDHPNAGGVLVLGLGCENNTIEGFRKQLGRWDDDRVQFLICQDVEDELETGGELLARLAAYAGRFARQPLPVSKLVVGMKCGGSDGLSGITANPVVGAFSDRLIARGGSTVLTEVPEMFGAETVLLNRCVNRAVFDKAERMIQDFKRYFVAHGQVVYENPSPGNKDGGITTLEDKSLGCVQKGGTAPVSDVVGYAGRVTVPGLTLMSGPGNDLVSATALTAAGAHLVLFTTGRGTPFGAPAPTVKIASNSRLFRYKPGWLDFNAGTVAEGETIGSAADRLLEKVLAVASGERTKSEEKGFREIAIFKDGVVL